MDIIWVLKKESVYGVFGIRNHPLIEGESHAYEIHPYVKRWLHIPNTQYLFFLNKALPKQWTIWVHPHVDMYYCESKITCVDLRVLLGITFFTTNSVYWEQDSCSSIGISKCFQLKHPWFKSSYPQQSIYQKINVHCDWNITST